MESLQRLIFLYAVLCWLVLGLMYVLLKRKSPEKPPFAFPSILGLSMQMAGFVALFAFQRLPFTPFWRLSPFWDGMFSMFCLSLGLLSLVLVGGALWQQNQEKSPSLLTHGMYRMVRHPGSAGLFGLILLTGFGISDGFGLLLGCTMFGYGTYLRIRQIEKKLYARFGSAYEQYAQFVPALMPYVY